MSNAEILTVLRTAVSAAIPGVRDWSDDPNNIGPASLPAFTVSMELTGAERVAIGSKQFDVEAMAQIEIFREAKKTNDNPAPGEGGGANVDAIASGLRARGQADVDAIRDGIYVDELNSLLNNHAITASEVELARGDTRKVRTMISLSIQFTM